MGVHVGGRSRIGSPRIQDHRGEAEEDRTQGEEGEEIRHVVPVVVVVAAEAKHHEEAAEEEAGDHRDAVEEVGDHHGAAAAAAHTCRKGEGEENEASSREEAGEDECHCRCGSRGRAFQSGDEGRHGARHLDDEDEGLAREAREVHEDLVPLHKLTTPHP